MTPGSLPAGVTFTRASTATYFDATGTMQTAAANTPRWDYDPVTHALNGLLIEEQRTNSAAEQCDARDAIRHRHGTVPTRCRSTAPAPSPRAAQRPVRWSAPEHFPSVCRRPSRPTAGTLTLTVTGTVLNAQLEFGALDQRCFPIQLYPDDSSRRHTRDRQRHRCQPSLVGSTPPRSSLAAEYMMTTQPAVWHRQDAMPADCHDGTASNQHGDTRSELRRRPARCSSRLLRALRTLSIAVAGTDLRCRSEVCRNVERHRATRCA